MPRNARPRRRRDAARRKVFCVKAQERLRDIALEYLQTIKMCVKPSGDPATSDENLDHPIAGGSVLAASRERRSRDGPPSRRRYAR